MYLYRRRSAPGSQRLAVRRYFAASSNTIVSHVHGPTEFAGAVPRGLMRRQLPPNADGRVFRRRVFIGGQGLTTVATDIRAAVETIRNFQLDMIGRTEGSLSLLSNVGGDLEASKVARVDLIAALENTGAIIVSSDGRGTVEVTARLSFESLGRVEFPTGTIIDRISQLEQLSRVSGDTGGNLEDARLLRNDTVGASEYSSLRQFDMTGRAEAVLGQLTNVIGEVEALGLAVIISDILGRAEALVSYRADLSVPSLETLLATRHDRAGFIETLGSVILLTSDGVGGLEILRSALSGSRSGIEALTRPRSESVGMAEFLLSLMCDQRGRAEAALGVSSDTAGRISFLVRAISDAGGLAEYSVAQHIDVVVPASYLRGIVTESKAEMEVPGGAASIFSSRGAVEIGALLRSEFASPSESTALVAFNVTGGAVEYSVGIFVDRNNLTEILSSFLSEWSSPLEATTSVTVDFETLGNLEISGFGIGFDFGLAVLVSGGTVSIEIGAPTESSATLTLDTRGTLEESFVGADLSTINLSIGRARFITVPYSSADLPPFDPLRAGEIDTFAFDFTPDVGAATIVSTTWACAIVPSPAVDAAAQARVILAQPATQLFTRSPLDEQTQTWTGAFSVAIIGTFPESAIGGAYILEATVYLSDGRVIKAGSTVVCAANVVVN